MLAAGVNGMSAGFFSFIWNIIWSCITFVFKAIWFIITLGWDILVFLCKIPFKIIGWCWMAIKFAFSLLGSLWDGCCWLIVQMWHAACLACSLVWDVIKTMGELLWNLIIGLLAFAVLLGEKLWLYKWWIAGLALVLYICVSFAKSFAKNKPKKDYVPAPLKLTKPKDWKIKRAARLKQVVKENVSAEKTKVLQITKTLPPQSKKGQFLSLYRNILDEVELLVKDLQEEIVNISNDDHYEQALGGLNQIITWRDQLVADVCKLADCADWDTFTFAFYGETNAGKSTLIESLRLLLQESTKLQEQKKYAAYTNMVASITNQIEQLEDSLEKLDSERAQQQQQITSISQQQQQAKVSFQQQQQALQEAIAGYKTQMSLLHPVTYFKMKKEISNKETERKNLLQKYNENQSALHKQQQEFEGTIQALDKQQISSRAQLKTLKEELAKDSQALSACQDGAIIGDGRPDYTRHTTAYQFCVDNTTFRLLDLPGIEGRENEVREVILSSLHQAHAVFYISSKNTPPQKGDAQQEGTLEKIKKHLNDQAEVYFIWNKRITNASSLSFPLEDASSAPALTETEQCLKQHLQAHYKGHFTLSAQPAFLGVAQCIERASTKNKQEKFFKQCKPEELVQKSKLQAFADFLIKQSDVAKIEKANVHKVYCVLQDTANIVQIYSKSTKEMYDVAKNEAEKASKEITNETNNLVAFIRRQRGGAAETIINDTRKNCYERIKIGVSSENMEAMVKKQLANNIRRVLSHIQEEIGKNYAQYEEKLNDIWDRLCDNLDFCCKQINKKMQVSVTIQSVTVSNPWTKGKIIGAVGSTVGIVGGIATLAGGAAKGAALAGPIGAIIGGIAGLIYIGVNVFRKKSRQRNAVDKALNQVEDALRNEIKEKLENYIQTVIQQAAIIEETVHEIPVPFQMQRDRIEKFISFLRVQADELTRRTYDENK